MWDGEGGVGDSLLMTLPGTVLGKVEIEISRRRIKNDALSHEISIQ